LNVQDYQNAAMRTAPEESDMRAFQRVLERTASITRIGNPALPELVGANATIFMGTPQSIGAIHGILGIVGEVSEFDEAFGKCFEDPENSEETKTAVVKEFGDIWWYVALLAKSMHWDFGALVASAATIADMITDDEIRLKPHEVSEPLKKWLFYGKPIVNDALQGAVANLMANATAMAGRLGIDIEEAHRLNIEKLRARFPEKFDEVVAQDHDGQ
jgi:NTP pyrophosphatase (non-canonical NTP hydrolase)